MTAGPALRPGRFALARFRTTTPPSTPSAKWHRCWRCNRRSCGVSTCSKWSARSRSDGGQRRYSRREIDHIDAINGLMGEGMTLAGAQRILELQAEIDQLRQQIVELEAR